MLRDVRYRGVAGRLGEESEMKFLRREFLFVYWLCASCAAAAFAAPAARAENISLPPEARQAMDKIYSGDPDAAIPIARAVQQAQPDHPLGYLLEGEALWWKRYCAAYELKYNIAESWKRGKDPGDEAYLALADKVIHTAQALNEKSESAEMHVYAGIGWGLKARVYALRSEYRNVARAGVNARTEMLRALQLDPQMADATAGLGLYDYYVDTLSPIVKLLRFFMGIPGGDKQTGVKEMEKGMNEGVLLAVHIRFVLARSLRQYDAKYEEALTVAQPLANRFPQNPLFQLLLGNINLQLGRKATAAPYFQAALNEPFPDPACAARLREIASALLAQSLASPR
jgi:tetratricopeptide (TPR) repeat protein